MRKLLAGFLSVALLSACGQTEEAQDKGVSKNEGQYVEEVNEAEEVTGVISTTLQPFKFKDAMKESELVADVTITGKVKEVDDKENGIPYTVFEAKVNDSMKGKAAEKITIKQAGTSELRVNNVKLFEAGEQYIFFLKETEQSESDYWIIGEKSGMFMVSGNQAVKIGFPSEKLAEIELPEQASEKAKSKVGKEKPVLQVLNKEKFVQKIKKGGE